MKIAYFGTGLLGAGFVRHLLDLGHEVNVWNRTPEKARALEADGAHAFDDPAAALAGVEQLHLTLADDATVDAVLEPLAGRIPPELLIADHTTTAPTPTGERVARWAARGRHFLHAPVFMGPQNAREGNGIMLASGERARFERFEPLLATMTTKVLYLGEDPARAAAFKLFGNLTIIVMTAGLADVNRLASALGIETADAFALFEHFNPGTMFPVRAKKIAAGDFTPTFEMTMARKDVRLMIEEARRHGVELGVMPAIAEIYDRAIARGDGALDTSAIAKVSPS